MRSATVDDNESAATSGKEACHLRPGPLKNQSDCQPGINRNLYSVQTYLREASTEGFEGTLAEGRKTSITVQVKGRPLTMYLTFMSLLVIQYIYCS